MRRGKPARRCSFSTTKAIRTDVRRKPGPARSTGFIRPAVEVRCPPGIFNDARIRVRGTRVEHWLNAACAVRFDMASEDFRARVARSKFARCPRFARAERGHLVLQHHGEEAWFRNLRLE